jgi:hypothetical protein
VYIDGHEGAGQIGEGGEKTHLNRHATGATTSPCVVPNVTTIFPSITFAAWASIYTGMTPSATGITGNEFFARDLIRYDTVTSKYLWRDQVPGFGYPLGMITLDADGGAFRPLIEQKPYSSVEKSLPFIMHHVMPAEISGFGYTTPADKKASSAPNRALQATPLWNEINAMTSKKYKYDGSGTARCRDTKYECRTAAFLNQYTRGADPYLYTDGVDWWGTPSNSATEFLAAATSIDWPLSFDSAEVMDKAAAEEAAGFIGDYFVRNNQTGSRKRFPAVFSVYLSGLDHKAHVDGMGSYKNYFMETTNSQVGNIVKALKDKDEFDNKIFIIVSDHGHTEMPTNLSYEQEELLIDINTGATYTAAFYRAIDMSCELKTDMKKWEVKESELKNNNLHIWELGTLFTSFAPSSAGIELLAPAELNNTGLNITQNLDQANVIAALNGPMAHIYVKGGDWQDDPDDTRLGEVIDTLIRTLTLGMNATDKVKKELSRLTTSVDKILVRRTLSGAYEVVTSVAEDASGNVTISTSSLASLSSSEYQKAVSRITGMNHANRSGDVVLIMKDATLGNAVDRYSTAYACKSWHGSLNSSDSYVPFIVSYPGGNKLELDTFLSPVCPANNCDGNWKLTDLVKEIMNKQYAGQ